MTIQPDSDRILAAVDTAFPVEAGVTAVACATVVVTPVPLGLGATV